MKNEQDFSRSLQQMFVNSEADVGADARQQLASIRMQALAQSGHQPVATHFWHNMVGLATAAGVCALVIGLSMRGPLVTQAEVAALPMEDINILADGASPDFYAELAFYKWLSLNERS